jgi:hypothetical protein
LEVNYIIFYSTILYFIERFYIIQLRLKEGIIGVIDERVDGKPSHGGDVAPSIKRSRAAALGVLEEGGERQPRERTAYVVMRRQGIFSTGAV